MPPQPRVITCPECETRVPLDPFESSATCPLCGANVSAVAPASTALPTGRGQDLVVSAPLSTSKEEWEPQIPAPREASFQDPLKSTEQIRSSDRRRRKRVTKRTKAMGWDAKGQKRGGLQRVHWAVLGIAASLVAVLGTTLGIKFLFFQKAPPIPTAALPEQSSIGVTASGRLSEEEGRQVLTVVESFLTAPSLAEMSQFVREPDRVIPQMEAFYGDKEWVPMVVRNLPDFRTLQTNGDLVAGEVEINDYEKKLVALQRVGDTYKIDWEAFVGWCEVPWDQLAAKRPTLSFLMRVKLTPDDYYNFDFQNPNDWACYRLTSADNEHSIYGYVRRGRPLHKELSEKLSQARLLLPTLKVSFRDTGTSFNQVQIDSFLANGWVLNSDATSPTAKPSPEASPTPTETPSEVEPTTPTPESAPEPLEAQ